MNDILQFLVRHDVAFLFIAVFIDQVGVPLPSMPWLLAAGALTCTGEINFWAALGVATVAGLLGDLVWFYLGRRFGNWALRLVCRLFTDPDLWVRRTQNLFNRYGMLGLVAAKFIPVLKTLAPAMAGSAGATVPRFLIFDGLGAALHGVVFILLGVVFSEQLDEIARFVAEGGIKAICLVLGGIAFFVVYKYFRRVRSGNG